MGPSRRTALLGGAALLLSGCARGPGFAPPTGVDGLVVPTPEPDPDDFVDGIDNPWLPLHRGSEWRYESPAPDRLTVTATVADRTRVVAGVATTEVRTVSRGGGTRTTVVAWFAQDRGGNVWAFGEEGRWLAGVYDARAGLAMPAEPRVGDGYQVEDAPGVAEDRATVVSLSARERVPAGSFSDLLVTRVTSPLRPGQEELRYHAREVGQVLAVDDTGRRLELAHFLVASEG